MGIARGAPSAWRRNSRARRRCESLRSRASRRGRVRVRRRSERGRRGRERGAARGRGGWVRRHRARRRAREVLVNVLDIAVAVVDAKRAAGPAQAMQALAAEMAGRSPRSPGASRGARGVRGVPPATRDVPRRGRRRVRAAHDVGRDGSAAGPERVKAVDALAVFLGSKSDAVAGVLSCDALPACFRLFHRYPFNNFLHHHVESMIDTVLEWGHPGLLERLFASVDEGGCDVVGMIADAPQTVETARGPARSGNLGHVTRIGNRLAAVAAGGADEGADEDGAEDGAGRAGASPDAETRRADAETRRAATAFVAAKLEADARWAPHVDGPLKQRNTVENVYKWACGRPAGMDDGGWANTRRRRTITISTWGWAAEGSPATDSTGTAAWGSTTTTKTTRKTTTARAPGRGGAVSGRRERASRVAHPLQRARGPRTTTTTRRAARRRDRGGNRGVRRTILRLQTLGENFDDSGGFSSSEEDEATWYSARTPTRRAHRRRARLRADGRRRRAHRRGLAERGDFSRVPARSVRPKTRRRRARRRRSRWNTTGRARVRVRVARYWGAAIDDSLVPDDA